MTRDKQVKRNGAIHNRVSWQECQTGAVIRGLKHRLDWDKRWQQYMRSSLASVDLAQINWLVLNEHQQACLPIFSSPDSWQQTDSKLPNRWRAASLSNLSFIFFSAWKKLPLLNFKPFCEPRRLL